MLVMLASFVVKYMRHNVGWLVSCIENSTHTDIFFCIHTVKYCMFTLRTQNKCSILKIYAYKYGENQFYPNFCKFLFGLTYENIYTQLC